MLKVILIYSSNEMVSIVSEYHQKMFEHANSYEKLKKSSRYLKSQAELRDSKTR